MKLKPKLKYPWNVVANTIILLTSVATFVFLVIVFTNIMVCVIIGIVAIGMIAAIADTMDWPFEKE